MAGRKRSLVQPVETNQLVNSSRLPKLLNLNDHPFALFIIIVLTYF